MKIQIISDMHNEFVRGSLPPYAQRRDVDYCERKKLGSPTPMSSIERTDSDVVVLAGDIDLGFKGVQWAAVESQILDKDIIYVAGNYEFYDSEYYSALLGMRAMANNTEVHFLERDSVVINGVRFLGCTLWTNYNVVEGLTQSNAMSMARKSLTDHTVIRIKPNTESETKRFLPDDALRIHNESVEWLEGELDNSYDGPTVVVTHHGPSPKCAHYKHGLDDISPGFISNLEFLMVENVDLWINGHTHSNHRYDDQWH